MEVVTTIANGVYARNVLEVDCKMEVVTTIGPFILQTVVAGSGLQNGGSNNFSFNVKGGRCAGSGLQNGGSNNYDESYLISKALEVDCKMEVVTTGRPSSSVRQRLEVDCKMEVVTT